MGVTVAPVPSSAWKELVRYPVQLPEYAEATRRLGYRALYCEADGGRAALVQTRGPRSLGGVFRRAYVYPSGEDGAFLTDLLRALERMRIPFVRIGDTMWGVAEARTLEALPFPARVTERHTAVLDVAREDRELLGAMKGAEQKIRRAERSRLEVAEVSSLADVEDYATLARLTADRIRARTAFTALPRAFFLDVYQHMVPSGYARLFLARVDGEPVAGSLCLVYGDTMTYYHGVSTRERAHRAREASTACLWAAVRAARASGLARFDLGGFTPTSDPSDSRHGVYWFKQRWGGAPATFFSAEVALSPLVCRLQQGVAAPLWQRLHPLLWRLIARPRSSGAQAC